MFSDTARDRMLGLCGPAMETVDVSRSYIVTARRQDT
jgi:hypothetical protein